MLLLPSGILLSILTTNPA
uniref:Uncharacterized protein n=1 Tax=Arundo donax TaxID=35708 RepID=A0A0A8XUL7_ARUDO